MNETPFAERSSFPAADVTGVLLAGGRSRRMGRDKALLALQGQPLAARVEAVLRTVCAQVVIAGDRPDLVRPDLPCYSDLFPGSPLGGLYTALQQAETPYIFAAACDLAWPDATLARDIITLGRGHDVAVIRTDKGWEPLFALYGKGCLEPMHRQLVAGNYRIYDFFASVRLVTIRAQDLPPGWERSLANLNTPDDLWRLTGGKER
jgi:molybdopterin-guanine dinucleotide biosynthesis protein A